MTDTIEEIRARHETEDATIEANFGVLAEGWATKAHADRATLLRALDEAQERAEWQPMETAPRDGRYILAIGAEADEYHIGRHAGRPFCIRYEFDLGWGVYPGYGGAPDRQFTCWKPLDLPAAQTLKERHDG